MDTREWREFEFNKIFEVKNAKNINSPDLEYTNNTNDTPHVSRQIEDNGIKGYVAEFDTKKLNKGHCLCVDMFLNSTWQEKDFLACDHVLTARNKNLNKFRALFVIAVLRNEQYRFSYGKIFSVEQSDFKINLPTTPDNQPDWQFMEDFIKKIYNKVIEEVKASAPALLSLSLSEKPPSPEM